jgi:DNA-binding beta-propeller fold protein YncE
MMLRCARFMVLPILFAGAALAQGKSGAGYHVLKKIGTGAEGGWDYLVVDTAGNRLFVSRGTHVQVIDLRRDSLIADIPNTSGVHGIALVHKLGKGFTSNGRDSTVTIFDLKTLIEIARVKLPARNPDAIIYDEPSNRVITFNGGSADATAIDPATGAVIGNVALGGKPEAAVSDGTGRVFVNIEDKSELVAFDARRLAVERRWSLAPCEEPTGLALDREHHRLFVGCSNKLMAVVNSQTGKLVTTLPIGGGVDGTAFDAATQLAFSSNGEGTLTVVHEDSPQKFKVIGNIPTQRGARTLALDPRTHRIYLSTAQFGETPPATAERPRPRPPMIPGSFTVLVVGK